MPYVLVAPFVANHLRQIRNSRFERHCFYLISSHIETFPQEKQWETMRAQLEEQLKKQGGFIPQNAAGSANHPDYAGKEGEGTFHFTSDGHKERWPLSYILVHCTFAFSIHLRSPPAGLSELCSPVRLFSWLHAKGRNCACPETVIHRWSRTQTSFAQTCWCFQTPPLLSKV